MATARDDLARQQIYIPATQPEEEIVLRVAAYCRVSTDSEDQRNSFAAQNTHYMELIETHDLWELVDIYADEGLAGTSAQKRKDFQRLLADCRKGHIDKVLVKSISRFARNTTECLESIRELKSLGISIYFEEHSIDTKMVSSEMLTAVIASCAQAESESISQNIRWGIQNKMQSGTYVASSVPFGFRRINGMLAVEEPEAKYVRYAFGGYLSGKSTSEIAKEFAGKSLEDPVLGRRKWSFQAVTELLRNEKYAGDALCQKTFMTDTRPRQCLRNRGERDQYYATNTHPAIIDRQIFEAVQKLLGLRSENHVQHTVKTSPLGGRFICGKCGAGFRRKQTGGRFVFACTTHTQDRNACDMLQIPEEEVYHAFQRLYYNLKNHPEILDFLAKNLNEVRNRQMLWSPAVIELIDKIIVEGNTRIRFRLKNGLELPESIERTAR